MNSSAPPINILIADDHPVTLEGLASLLSYQAGLRVVCMAENGEQAVAMYRQHRPNVVLMDMVMPKMSGMEALKAIRDEFPQARIILLSLSDGSEHIYQAIRNGAMSYLLKDTNLADVRQAVLEAAAGRPYLTPDITQKLTERMRLPELTAREMEILRCMVQGRSNQEIAATLFIAEGTVKVHVSNILGKLGVSDRTQAVTTAVKRGLVGLSQSFV